MKKFYIIILFHSLLFLLNCSDDGIVMPDTSDKNPGYKMLPQNYQGLFKNIEEPLKAFQDIRYADVQKLNLVNELDILKTLAFSSFTRWPNYSRLPADFDPRTVMEWGKDPGLNIKALQSQGYDGNEIRVAIIDQKLLLNHSEYDHQVAVYQEFPNLNTHGPQMHGAAVASLLVGQSCGIIPEANLHYYAVECSNNFDYQYYSQALEHIIEGNHGALLYNPIRVVSVSMGFAPEFPNLEMWKNTLQKAEDAGILVFHTSFDWIKDRYGLHGARCIPYEEKDNPQNYQVCSWGNNNLSHPHGILFIPCENRTTADFILDKCYDFWGQGGLSWAMPYIAGVAALGISINPKLSNDEIVALLYETGTEFNGYKLINPTGFINAVKGSLMH